MADERFSEGGKFAVEPAKVTLLDLGLHGGGLGDTWARKPGRRAGGDLGWFVETVHGLGLPLVLKGILHPDDARKAVEAGCDGIFVSTHGGRQVDGSISAIEALPSCIADVKAACAAVGKPPLPVFFDSGIRYGQHVFKAKALGATAVLYGRPVMMALVLGGAAGVSHTVSCLLGDTECTLGAAGFSNWGEVDEASVVRAAAAGRPPLIARL
eukprot:SAG11_NODE_5675_length_1489_cov_2.040288_2_plen_212_part_00